MSSFAPVLAAGLLAWAITITPLFGRGTLATAAGLLAPLVLLAGALSPSRRWSAWLGIYGFLGAVAFSLWLGPHSHPLLDGGLASRTLAVLAWCTYALAWGAPLARELPLLEPSEPEVRLEPRRTAPWFAYLVPGVAAVLAMGLLVPWGVPSDSLTSRPELRMFVQLAGVACALGLLARVGDWGAARHFDSPFSSAVRLRAALGPLLWVVVLAAALAALHR
ncbi:MAG TPA: hypothetical protein VLC09_18360 [Polyangiaceae bacterium]|nr:hypothetical protein [Polyangiaceae bacterium]